MSSSTPFSFHWRLNDESTQFLNTLMYSYWTQQYYDLDNLNSSDFQFSLISLRFFGIIPWAQINGILVTFMFQDFFNSLARSRYFSSFSLTFTFTQWSAEMKKIHKLKCSCWLKLGLVFESKSDDPLLSQNIVIHPVFLNFS